MLVYTLVQKTTRFATGGSQSSSFASAEFGFANPVNLGVVSNRIMVGVHENNFVVLVFSIMPNPVGAQDAERLQSATSRFLSSSLERHFALLLSDTLEKFEFST